MLVLRSFSEHEVVTLLEVARLALADADMFDRVAEEMDIEDDEMISLREKLQQALGEDEAVEEEFP